MYVLILGVGVHFEHLVNERVLAQGAEVELIKTLLVLQASQGLAQLIQRAHSRYGMHGLGSKTQNGDIQQIVQIMVMP